MPSRRQILVAFASVSTSGLTGCARLTSTPPKIKDQPCPPGEFVQSPVSCSHSDTPAHGVAVRVSPSTISDQSAIDDFRIEIKNKSQTELSLDAAQWRVWTKSGSDWERFDENEGNNQSPDRVTLVPNKHVSWTGLRTAFDVFDSKSPPGLYIAVLPVRVQDKHVNCVCLFRIMP